MAKAIESNTTSRFHNLSDSALGDALDHADTELMRSIVDDLLALKG